MAELLLRAPVASFREDAVSNRNNRRTRPLESVSLPPRKKQKHGDVGPTPEEIVKNNTRPSLEQSDSHDSSTDLSAQRWFDTANRDVNQTSKFQDQGDSMFLLDCSVYSTNPL